MNFILANCKHGQRIVGTELAPKIIYNKLLKNVYKKDLTKKVSINEKYFINNRGYNMIYNEYYNYNMINTRPIITLGGDHSVSIGSCQAFLDKYKDDGHIVWIDAHTDINTKETSKTGNTHGMVVSQLMGLDKSFITNKQYDLKPEQITYLGPRCIDMKEKEILNEYNMKVYSSQDIKLIGIFYILHELQKRLNNKKIHISFDIDIFDPHYVKSTGTPVNYGLNLWEIYTILKYICKNNSVKSCDFVEYNPLISDKDNVEKSLLNLEISINSLLKYI